MVYEETLQLIEHLPLASKMKVKIHGIDTICLFKAKEYLQEPIDVPDRCNAERLMKRVVKLPLDSQEKLAVFEKL